MKKYALFLVVVMPLMFSCVQRHAPIPHGVIGRDTMKRMLLDLHLLESAANMNKLQGEQRGNFRIYEFVYNKYGVTEATFDSSFYFYRNNPDILDEMYREILDEAVKLQAKEGQ